MPERERFRLGMLGGGAFGHFAVQEFTRLPGVELVALAETRRDSSRALAQRLEIPLFQRASELLQREEVDLVYVATPPFLHREHVLSALEAGKHVLCEKPLALDLGAADEMLAKAKSKGLLLATNLMQRYGDFHEPVRAVVERGLLGAFLHGSFENHASDEGLHEQHWFWDRAKSGGIFVEHGVHFFDVFAGWFGEGRVVAAERCVRAGTGFEDQVQCTVRYPNGSLVNHYHGFTQPSRLERQALELSFERGSILLEGWIPTSLRLRAVVDEAVAQALSLLLPQARLEVLSRYSGAARRIENRQHPFDATQQIELVAEGAAKSEIYGRALRALLSDQIRRIRDPGHVPRSSEANGRASLVLALDASRRAAEQSAIV